MIISNNRRWITLSVLRNLNNTIVLGAEMISIAGTISYDVATQVAKGAGVNKAIWDPRDEIMKMATNRKDSSNSDNVNDMKNEIEKLKLEQIKLLKTVHESQLQIAHLLKLSQSSISPVASDGIMNTLKPQKSLGTASVPSTQIARATKLTTLAARLALNASWRRVTGKGSEPGVLSNKTLDVLVDRLCHMRGAALKLGQLLSIQDQGLVPPHVLDAFKRVRDQTYAMPQWQMEIILKKELGNDWETKFKEFDKDAIAAASLGQVHKATLHDGTEVAVKVQFQGVAESISSDVNNLRWLFSFGILPKGLYVDNILKELQRELERECDYVGEASRHMKYKQFLESDPERHGDLSNIHIPNVIPNLSTTRVLTTEWVEGVSCDALFLLEESSQDTRNRVGESFLRLTLKELFDWKMMQTDPSFANFLYNYDTDSLNLIDFGAAREFSPEFIETYILIVFGASIGDREMIISNSQKLGLLTGEEVEEMLDAHTEAACIASLPFKQRGAMDFKAFDISSRMKQPVGTMLRLRLTAPPLEVYSLHRRLNGCFQFMNKLGAVVDCRRVFIDVLRTVIPNLSEDCRDVISLKY